MVHTPIRLYNHIDVFRHVDKGRLLLAFGNRQAIEKGTRGSEEKADLNRAFPPVAPVSFAETVGKSFTSKYL